MKKLFAFLQLIRWPNLIIMAVNLIIIWLFLLLPLEKLENPYYFLNGFHFSVLLFSILTIAAAGYIINDVHDIEIDLVNKPDRVIISKKITQKSALQLYYILNGLGFIAGIYLAWKVENILLISIQVFSIILLWFYAVELKKNFMTGNIVISFLTALLIFSMFAYEPTLMSYLENKDIGLSESTLQKPITFIFIFQFFSFFLTWMREIVKDLEDVKGDIRHRCRTLPIVWGIKKTARFLIILNLITSLSIISLLIIFKVDHIYFITYLLITILAPLFYLLFIFSILYRSSIKDVVQNNKKISRSSLLLKSVMLFGILSLLFYPVI